MHAVLPPSLAMVVPNGVTPPSPQTVIPQQFTPASYGNATPPGYATIGIRRSNKGRISALQVILISIISLYDAFFECLPFLFLS